ncbi:MAG: DUF1501 domain-containing protein [Planctomycetota bacterium]|nr:DUF1501 domain-containing protein [Planctomycetota bacterium]
MSRRTFLKRCGLAGLGFAAPIHWQSVLSAPQTSSETAGYPGPYYVVFNASGGWDTTYLMDPKGVDGINRLYQQGDILTVGNHRIAPIAKHIESGMSNEDFFAKYGPELRVIHGLDLSVNNHTPCARYMATGKLDSLAYPTFPALVAACHGAQAPLAFLTFGNYSATGNLVPMSRVPYLQSLRLLARADSVEGGTHAYQDAFVADRIERALEEQFQSRISNARLPRVERSQSMLYAAQANSKALERVVPFLPKEPSKERLPQQNDIALAAFKAGVCISANLSIGQFDSHNNNDKDQMKLIPELLAGIDDLLRKAEQLQIRDKLVVIIQSEMGRTPTYNNGNGKDHWSINSIMFLGPGIAGNRVLGGTDEKQQLIPVNAQTLECDKVEGIRIRPEHIHQALRELANVQDHPFSQRFPLEVPAKEKLQRLWS